MKNCFFLSVACIAMFLCSCQKEDLNNSRFVNNAVTAKSTNNAATNETLPLSGTKNVTYGALIEAPGGKGSVDFQTNVANQLGITCLRSRVIVPGISSAPILNTGYKIMLNFNNDYEGTPLPFVSDLTTYQEDLKNTLSRFSVMPVVAVIENEESNAMYHAGSAQAYINQLNVAIGIMHAYGIKVANGGITDNGLNYLVYQDFIMQGKYDSAEQFKQLTRVTIKNTATKERGAFIDELLQAYAQMDLDYVNFHWKNTSPDTQAFKEVIAYLKKRTGKPVISNELGQFDTDPNTLVTMMQVCSDKNFPYALWYSPDENAGRKDTPLHHNDASLTPTGLAYQNLPKY